MRTFFILCAASIALLAACGGDDPVAPDADLTIPDAAPREVISETVTLAPGQLAEGVMNGGPADLAVIHLEAPIAELDWNIHGHEGGTTQTIYEELNVVAADYDFTPTSETDWWLLIRNSGPTAMDVDVRVELYGAMTWAWE